MHAVRNAPIPWRKVNYPRSNRKTKAVLMVLSPRPKTNPFSSVHSSASKPRWAGFLQRCGDSWVWNRCQSRVRKTVDSDSRARLLCLGSALLPERHVDPDALPLSNMGCSSSRALLL
ncbi:hypothetical protein EXIGLDRAFT_494584 [Exidia glandulosa HHB12029]|uniref:Uncharacterized protein n=1 Tax=Exidia glandulosa HHB12029 TaxID=1314781 RepID=A0A165JK51_EXIGL|nr:hypothetical protein EXIGLDRAFT_494584 [Exidia glandulosa HHB12029]